MSYLDMAPACSLGVPTVTSKRFKFFKIILIFVLCFTKNRNLPPHPSDKKHLCKLRPRNPRNLKKTKKMSRL